MIDRVQIYIKAGKGGDGCESYENRGPRKYYPTGGNGGRGGDIIFRADANARDLEYFKFNPHQVAENGQQGSSNRKTGKTAKNLILRVPIGTRITNKESDYLIRDLEKNGDEVVAVRGGQNGRGNHDNLTPTKGKPGEECDVILNYTITSDIVLIGLPNSGRSTILSKLTHAKVKVAEYPFSTIAPQLGSFECEDYSKLILCDLPSLSEGSHEGKGVGNHFLKHALRARMIFYVIDPQNTFCEDVASAVTLLEKEVSAFNEDIRRKDVFILINKDDIDVDTKIKKDKDRLKKKYRNVYNVSAATGEGLEKVMQDAEKVLQKE